MASTWRKTSEDLTSAADMNAKKHFTCSNCGIQADAAKGTERAKRLLCKNCFGKREDKRENRLNNLTGSEWASLSKSVEQYDGTRSEKQRIHGAAFPQSLAEAHIKVYTKKDDLVLDPFLGVGTTTDAARALGRRSVGIELNPEFAALAANNSSESDQHKIICGNALDLSAHIPGESVDFILTSPPYATLLKNIKGKFGYKWREHSNLTVQVNPAPYSRHHEDLGNLAYADFMEAIESVQRQCYRALKNSCYSVWVVKDYRDLKASVPYVNFHGDIIRASEAAGFTLWDIKIYDQTKFRPLVVLGYPSRNYYLNIGHSYILIFRKY
ncbi:DNA methyltransferase [Diaphorobacter nitroreducens]|uniref:DNA methyltransferase n=1 Tax=Diaphorobacter nitroreducens TaxID=164759 RepID=UPI00289C05D5|nr:DNA methyltransferase [Diaphorobacter nitroreducens]